MAKCFTKFAGLETSCGSNLTSVKNLWIGAFGSANFTFSGEDVDADGNQIIESVTGATLDGDAWVEFGFRKNTGEMTTEMTVNENNGSHYFTNGVNLVFAKQDQTKRLSLQAVASGECSMIVLDSNGIYWLIGNADSVTATVLSATTGVAVGDNNAYNITLSAIEPYMPIPLDKASADTIIGTLCPKQASN